MVKISRQRISLIIFMTGLTCGIILTLITATFFISYRIDKYYQKIEALQDKALDQEVQLLRLNESLDKRKFILKKIEIHTTSKVDEADFALIKTSIKQKLDALIGREVKSIDTDLLIKIIDKRIMDTGIKQYKLKLTRLILSDTLSIWIEADILE